MRAGCRGCTGTCCTGIGNQPCVCPPDEYVPPVDRQETAPIAMPRARAGQEWVPTEAVVTFQVRPPSDERALLLAHLEALAAHWESTYRDAGAWAADLRAVLEQHR